MKEQGSSTWASGAPPLQPFPVKSPTFLKVKLSYYSNSIEAEGESEDVRKILASFLTLVHNGTKENPF